MIKMSSTVEALSSLFSKLSRGTSSFNHIQSIFHSFELETQENLWRSIDKPTLFTSSEFHCITSELFKRFLKLWEFSSQLNLKTSHFPSNSTEANPRKHQTFSLHSEKKILHTSSATNSTLISMSCAKLPSIQPLKNFLKSDQFNKSQRVKKAFD